MAIYRGAGGAGDATQDAASEVLLALQAKDAAIAAQVAAQTSESNAATSATNAATSATNASNSATSATTQATNAATSATSAAGSASTATTQATNAASSASAASTSATNAASSASAASTSASNAASSASSASTSASTATTQATNAATLASAAATSATNAAGSATAAATSASNAATSATSASGSASTATTQATNASNSASAASTSASNAASSASAAATSASNAASSATSAAGSATTATTQATNASNSATAASTSATNAANSATAAATSATNAANSATSAATSATNAANSATAAAASAASINPASIVITGGSINGTTIGATTPSTGKFTTLEATGVTTVQAGTVSAPAITTSGDTNTGIFFPAADTIAFTEGGAEAMRIDSSGRVGIGATSPTYTLEVATGTSGQQSLANFRTADSTAANNAGLQIFATPSATAGSRNVLVSWDADGANTSGGDYFYIQKLGNSGNVELAQYSNAAMIFSTNVGTERMRITSGGNVGIGTSSPAFLTEIVGGATTVETTLFQVRSNAGGIGTGTTIALGNSTNPTAGSGRVELAAIRTTTSGGSFVIRTGDDSGNIQERMRINSNGNVSIGNTTATYTLDVTGSIRASTYFYASGGSAGHGIYLADGSSNGLISQMSNGSASTLTYIGNQTITTSSDIRIKNNIRPTERNALDLLGQWEIVDHNWNDPSDQCENNKNSRGVWTGVIAQQIQPITPWLVNKPLEDENKDGSKNLWLVDFAYSVPLLVKAIQEQQAQIEELKQEIAALKAK